MSMNSSNSLSEVLEVSSDHLNNLYTRAKSNRSRSNKKTLFQLPLHSNNWEKHSLRYRGTNILNFLIDEGLYPNDLLELTVWSLNDKIHSLKGFLLLIPDDTLFSIIQ